jgi:type I restriction enzyme, S subunit
MKQYTKMKDSGIEWIGDIPEEWKLTKLFWSFKNIGSGTTPKKTKDYYANGTVSWVNSGDLNDSFIDYTKNLLNDSALNDHSILKFFPKNTVIIAMYGATIGKLGILKEKAVTNQACCNLSDSKTIDFKFLFYWFLAFRKTIISFAEGGGQPNINMDLIKNIRLFYPETKEQKQIIKFLDKQTSKIDLEIQKNTKLVTLLQEKKQATINHAVTKGLDDSIPMKDSGVGWIGEIPEEWEINKIKFTSYVKGRIGFHGLRSEEFTDSGAYLITGTDFKDGQIRWSTCHHVELWRYDQDPYIQIRKNDVLITKDGTIGKIAFVENVPDKTTLNSGVMVVRPLKKEFEPRYFFWLLKSNQFLDFISMIKSGSTIQHLYQETFENFQFTLPVLDEQKQIAKFLDKQTKQFDELISKAKLQIKTLQEYRQSLISSAVTGKIDVREAIA